METENARRQRWSKVQDQAEDILHGNTPYPIIRSVLKGTLEAIKQCDAAGRPADAYNLLREAEYMMKDLGSHPLRAKDEQWQDIGEQYMDFVNNKRLGWLNAAGAAIVTESDWHIYKEPNYPYNISHRSIAVDVVIKEGNDYFVVHEDLRQNYAGGKYGSYDLLHSLKTPLQQKVNYK